MEKRSYKDLICGPIKEMFREAANESKNVLPTKGGLDPVHDINGATGGYVLVNVQAKSRRHSPAHQAEPFDDFNNTQGDTA